MPRNMTMVGTSRNCAEKIRPSLASRFHHPDEAEDFPDKPKWMRWRTYHRLEAEDDRLMEMYEGGFSMMVAGLLKQSGN